MGVMKTLNVARAMSGRSGGFGVSANIKEMFFDRRHVIEEVEKAGMTWLGRAGGYVRKAAQRSFHRVGRARKAPSKYTKRNKLRKSWERWIQEVSVTPASMPGRPPNTHTGFMPNSIAYGYDPTTKSAVIGPWRSPWLNRLHEYGGTHPMTAVHLGRTTWLVRRGQRIGRNAKRIRDVMVRYPARPFMRPALEKSRNKLPELWRNSIGSSV